MTTVPADSPHRPEPDLEAALAAFGHSAFRPGQREAMETLLEQRRLLLVAPTGGGKSLIYQLPATVLPGTTLVISPLIALMHDQVDALTAQGIAATYLASTLSGNEMRTRMAKLAAGEFKLAYVSPERLSFPGFQGLLHDLRPPLVAIDEAHCISEWGHDFRPEYMQIGSVLESLGPMYVLACTATATPVVRDEIVSRLGLPPETPQRIQGFARPNLVLRAAEALNKRDRVARVDAALAEALGSPGGSGSAIVYAATRKSTEEEAARLAEKGWGVGCYHAGRTPKQRETTQRAFSDGDLEVVVATNAFGMGIDRADVRAVVHLAPPGSIEAYYQEVGRAGRDGDRAYGLLLCSSGDMPLRRRLLESDTDGRVPDAVMVEHKWNMFLELMRWADGGSCRHDAILRYFGDEAETLGGCGQCDVCQALGQDSDPEEVELLVRKALSGIARVHGRFGMTAAIKLLRGDADPRLERMGLDQVSTFGILRDHPEAWIGRLLRRCTSAGWISFTATQHPVVLLTEDGRAVMAGRMPARLVLPEVRAERSPSSGRSSRRAPAPVEDLDPTALELFERLRAHRLALSQEAGVPPYVVASDRSLRDIALLRPATLDDLCLAHGIGPTKAERYGEGLLDVVAQPPGPGR